ncbi:WD40 repeat domain-containing protein [Catenovulum adriaticum]|uniref:NWD2 C-terminal beta-propeller domain-containing protein n=1 Tax=Catenovulum adriaticum TaxID=2984846 RepID=A0ABY7AK70_9ALTE|nr:hypothetical protein [Catenovulum sp. TS8]WAJ69965.1 hypothetical protein OLW01_12575 [Catenovulum sp. TS8]
MLLTRVNLIIIILSSISLCACQPITPKPKQSFIHSANGSVDAFLSNDSNWLLVSSQTNQVQLWNLQEQALTYIWQQSSTKHNPVYLIHISAGNEYAVLASRTEFSLWNMHSGKNIGYWQVKDSNIRDIVVNRTGSKVVLGKSNGDILIFNPQTQEQATFFAHSQKINQIALSNDGQYLISASNDYTALLWDINKQTIIQRFVHPQRVTQVAISADNQLIFASSGAYAAIYDSKSGNEVSRLSQKNHQQSYTAVRFSADSNWLATGSPDRQLMLWQVQTGKLVNQWQVAIKQDNPISGAIVYSLAFKDGMILSDSSSGITEYWRYK